MSEELNRDQPKYLIPLWCRLPMIEHRTFGGCWSILHGIVERCGEAYCKTCEYHERNRHGKSDVETAK